MNSGVNTPVPSPARRPAMIRSLGLGFALLIIATAIGGQPDQVKRSTPPAAENKAGWTAEDILRQLARQPDDPYLQYVAVQLARREGRVQDIGWRLMRGRFDFGAGRRERTDLFNTFTGALAIQESLQLDTLLGDDEVRPGGLMPP